MIKVILALIILVNGFFAYRLVVDLVRHKSEVRREPGSNVFFAFLGIVSQFLSTFGVSDFAFNAVAFRLTKTVEDKKIPGTLNTACVIPVAFMALAYITVIKVGVLTLVVLIIAQTTGSYLTPRIVVKLPVSRIRIGIAIGLAGVAAAVYLVKSMDVDVIKWVVFVVVLYASLDLIYKEFRLKKLAFQPNQ